MSMQKSAVELRIEQLLAENAELRAQMGSTMGVGCGGGKLFVHGDYDSIKAAQAIVLERDRLKAEVEALRPDAEKWRSLQSPFLRATPVPLGLGNCLACGQRNGHGGLPCPRLNTYLTSIGKDGGQ